MATRSLIGKIEDGTFTGIYVHWDGSTHLETLIDYYNTPERVDKLIELGSLSSLHKYLSLEEKKEKEINVETEHYFGKPAKDVCVAYHRDRKEDLNIIECSSILRKNIARNSCCEYIYYFKNNQWYREVV